MFTNEDLRKMIVPLFFEQLLVMLVGIADTFIVSCVGESAVSGVSLVNMFNTVFIYLFTALASGGAVMISQYIGNKDKKNAILSSSQLLMFSTIFSIVIAVLVCATNEWLLRLMFGQVDNAVMESCVTYLRISAYSYPMLAIYNAGAAMQRSLNEWLLRLMFGQVDNAVMESCVTYLRISAYSYPMLAIYNAGAAMQRSLCKTKVTMYISIIANIINVIGNIIGVFVLKAGVAGVAYPSLIARLFSAIAITILCFKTNQEAYYTKDDVLTWDVPMLSRILKIAIPNGVENGIFQLVKVALGSVVALFGTYQIAANGIAQSIWSLAALVGSAMGPVFITVIGQCQGAQDDEATQYYFKKLMKITLIFSIAWNGIVFALTPIFMQFYAVSEPTKELVIILVLIHNVFNTVAFPFSGPLSNGLRATGDVKYTMIVSIASTVGGRLVLSIILGIYCHMGVIGIAYAMCLDWSIRAIIFYMRYRSGKWKEFQLLGE